MYQTTTIFVRKSQQIIPFRILNAMAANFFSNNEQLSTQSLQDFLILTHTSLKAQGNAE